MIPAAFDYVRAESAQHATSLLAEQGDEAKLLAGGHSLLPMVKLRLATPGLLIDVAPITELRYVRVEGDELAVGALSRHADLAGSPIVRDAVPLLGVIAGRIGDPQVRHRGTIGGSLAHADPSADLPTAVTVLDATIVVTGPAGPRRVAAADFFTDYFTTVLEPDEMVTEIRIPVTGSQEYGYQKFTRRANDWSIVAVAVAGDRVALANMGATPIRAIAVEEALANGADIPTAAALAVEGTAPTEDMHADKEFRRHLATVLTARALASRTPVGRAAAA